MLTMMYEIKLTEQVTWYGINSATVVQLSVFKLIHVDLSMLQHMRKVY